MYKPERDTEKFDVYKEKKRVMMFFDILGIIIFLPVIFIILGNLLRVENIIGKIIVIGVLLMLLSTMLSTIFKRLENEYLEKVFQKIPIVIFLVFWFGFTSTLTFVALINKEYVILSFLSIFWIFGFVITYRDLLKKN